jgi:hypothetical protein
MQLLAVGSFKDSWIKGFRVLSSQESRSYEALRDHHCGLSERA